MSTIPSPRKRLRENPPALIVEGADDTAVAVVSIPADASESEDAQDALDDALRKLSEAVGGIEVSGDAGPLLIRHLLPDGTDPATVGAFFDVDQTLVRGATSFWAAREMFRRSFFGVRDLAYAARKTIRYVVLGEQEGQISTFGDRAASLVAGKTLEELELIAQSIFESYFIPKVYKGTFSILKAHIEAGHTVYLVSATPWLIAEELARRLGAAGGIGTKTKIHDGLLVGELDGRVMHGAEKVVAVEEIAAEHDLDLANSFAYSDSANDIPMLSLVGHPVAVNPDRALRAYARAKGWTIYRAYERSDLIKRGATNAVLVIGATGIAYLILRGGSKGWGHLWKKLTGK